MCVMCVACRVLCGALLWMHMGVSGIRIGIAVGIDASHTAPLVTFGLSYWLGWLGWAGLCVRQGHLNPIQPT